MGAGRLEPKNVPADGRVGTLMGEAKCWIPEALRVGGKELGVDRLDGENVWLMVGWDHWWGRVGRVDIGPIIE
jgi:hypothetical protein